MKSTLVCVLDKQLFIGHNDGLVEDCGISSADALEIRQSCSKPSACGFNVCPWSVLTRCIVF